MGSKDAIFPYLWADLAQKNDYIRSTEQAEPFEHIRHRLTTLIKKTQPYVLFRRQYIA